MAEALVWGWYLGFAGFVVVLAVWAWLVWESWQ